jgi:hypothetical protein
MSKQQPDAGDSWEQGLTQHGRRQAQPRKAYGGLTGNDSKVTDVSNTAQNPIAVYKKLKELHASPGEYSVTPEGDGYHSRFSRPQDRTRVPAGS